MEKFVRDVVGSRTADEAWSHFVNKMLEYRFDRLIYGFTPQRGANRLGTAQDQMLLSTQTPEYMREFVGNGLYISAPMVRWAMSNEGACSWMWIHENFETLTAEELKVLEFNKKMGVTAGYTVSFRETNSRSKAGLALAAENGMKQAEVDAIWDEHGDDLLAMAQVTHFAIVSLPREKNVMVLTRRQREVLQLVGEGKTTSVIADILGLTAPTVEKHLRLARDTLDSETTAQALLKAAYINQIYVLEA